MMNKNLFMFIVVGVGFLYFITNFIGDIQKKDDRFSNSEYNQEHKFDEYQMVDSIGQEILNLSNVDEATQIASWNASSLKQEWLLLFPDFSDLKYFIKERLRGKAIQDKLINLVNKVESQYFSGAINAEQAKLMLDSLK